jgi:hypothetical protein
MNGYELSRNFFDWSFENPERVNSNHCAIFFYAIEHCNRLGWKEKFGFPSKMVMDAVGIKNWRTYSKALNDLVDFGFITMIEISKNQYTSNIIAIAKNTKATTKALDKAMQMQNTSLSQSIVSIDKPINNNKPINHKQNICIPELDEFLIYAKEQKPLIDEFSVKAKYDSWIENDWQDGNNKKIINWKTKLKNTLPYLKENNRLTENQHNKRKTF